MCTEAQSKSSEYITSSVHLPCKVGAAWVWVLDSTDRMLSGVISTLERIFANGFGGAGETPRVGVFKPPVRVVGLVGVPGEGREAGLTPGREKEDNVLQLRNVSHLGGWVLYKSKETCTLLPQKPVHS